MKIFRSPLRCRYISFCLIFITLLSCLIVPAAAAPTSDDGVISGLLSGWSGTSSPLYYNTSWFWQVLVELRDIDTTLNGTFNVLKSGWSSDLILTPGGYSNSWYAIIRNLLYSVDSSLDLVQPAVDNIKGNVDLIEVSSASINNYISNYLPGLASDIGNVKANVLSLNNYVADMKVKLTSLDSSADTMVDHLENISVESVYQTMHQEALVDNSQSLVSISDDILSYSMTIDQSVEWMADDVAEILDIFNDPNELAAKRSASDRLFTFNSFNNSKSGFQDSHISTLFAFSNFFTDSMDFDAFANLNDLLSVSESWFSDVTYHSLSVGAGAASLLGYSTFSRDVPDPTPLLDENIEKMNEWLGDHSD